MELMNDGKRKNPNILFILADDLGWKDTGIYGSEYFDTPNIDSLAAEGMMFSNAYSANPLCSPTRASIMTGKNPDRVGITSPWCHMEPQDPSMPETGKSWEKVLIPNPRTYLPHREYTLAEAMRDGSYNTVFLGKWHLGQKPFMPEEHGFEDNIGGMSWGGPKSYFSPYHNPNLPDGPDGEHLTDRLVDEAANWIENHQNSSKPFFMCLWNYAVHSPYQAKEKYIQMYEEKVDPCGEQNCPTMAAMIKSLDEGVGKMMNVLDKTGLADNTIVIFMSDNGPSKGEVDGVPVSSASPLRGKKGSLYEGGVRVPLIIRWPEVVEPNTKCDAIVTSTDMYATVLEMAGLEPQSNQARDSKSIIPLLKKEESLAREAIFCHYPFGHGYMEREGEIISGAVHHISGSFVRVGKWKLIRRYDTNQYFPEKYQLFNLQKDIGETINLADQYPEKVQELEQMLDNYLDDTGALVPQPNPDYDPKTRNL